VGRHRDDVAPQGRTELAGWGLFATAVAAVLVGITERGWVQAGVVAVLGLSATAALWSAERLAVRRRLPGGRRPDA
jgi:hypothetical protein